MAGHRVRSIRSMAARDARSVHAPMRTAASITEPATEPVMPNGRMEMGTPRTTAMPAGRVTHRAPARPDRTRRSPGATGRGAVVFIRRKRAAVARQDVLSTSVAEIASGTAAVAAPPAERERAGDHSEYSHVVA